MLTAKNSHDITDENYYSKEMGKKYLSVHALMTFLENPGLFWLKQNGFIENTSSDAANAGRMFHAFMHSKEDFHDEMMALGKTPFNVGRGKNAPTDAETAAIAITNPHELDAKDKYVCVWNHITENWHRREEIWTETRENAAREIILTGEIGGAPFKGRLDELVVDGRDAYIYDYKTLGLKNYYGRWYDGEEWHEKTFIHEYNYDLQMTAYAELVRQNFPEVRNVHVQFGVLVKKGTHNFSRYDAAFIETEVVSVRDLSTPRFDGRTPFAVLDDEAGKAYRAMHMTHDELVNIYGTDVLMEVVMPSGKQLPFEAFILK